MHETLDAAIVSFDENTGIGEITMNRPDALNALSAQLRNDIIDGLDLLGEQDADADGVALRAVILEGAGDRAFCAGADITEFGGDGDGTSTRPRHYETIREFPVPIIAKIDGYCLGGGFETALSADFRFASERSTFGFPEIDLGFLPGAGGGQMVSKIAGPAVAKELAITGKHIPAERAAEEGLVHDVFAADDLDEEVQRFAEEISTQAPLAVREIKGSINLSAEVGLEEGIRYDRQAATQLRHTDDFAEGTAAFAEKRDPEFEGK